MSLSSGHFAKLIGEKKYLQSLIAELMEGIFS